MRKGIKTGKHLCLLATHPNLVPKVTETRKRRKRACRKEEQTQNQNQLELQKGDSAMRCHCLNTYCVQSKGSSFHLTWLCVYV